MLGMVVFILLIGLEAGFLVYSLWTKSYQKHKKNIVKIALFVLFVILVFVGIIKWSFRWYLLTALLLVQALKGIWYLVRKSKKAEKTYRKKYVIISLIGNVVLIILAVLPAIIFPQTTAIMPTGKYQVSTVSYTLTDPKRLETFSDQKENRKVTIQLWYPQTEAGTYPLAVFSHGAFGFRGSNSSTFKDLASNGYVVCSIDHTYHAFITRQTDGKTIMAKNGFINDALAVTNGDCSEKKTYELSHEWLKLRIDDENFVLDDILSKAAKQNSDKVYQLIDTDKIGLFGHSLGGATSAELARERSDIDAVIVIDGSMFGEEIAFENGKEVLNPTPFPVPLLNLYNEQHYKDALECSDTYSNMVATAGAADARQIVFKGAGHLNFTDLPLFSPFLAGLLGKGDIDSRYCIKTMNKVVLEYYNYYLKGIGELNLQTQY